MARFRAIAPVEEADLLREVCRMIVRVGFAEKDEDKTVRTVARAGCTVNSHAGSRGHGRQ